MKFSPKQLRELKNSYDKSLNLTQLISDWGFQVDLETITLIYDLQAGTYTKLAAKNSGHIDLFTSEIASVLSNYIEKGMSVLDCGAGEGSTLIPILKKLGLDSGFAIDASISRLLWAQQNAKDGNLNLNLAVSDLGQLPLGNNAVDAIITIHALEPNGGREVSLISELGRVARRYLFLVEPDYENGSDEQKTRMNKFGYVTDLDGAISKSGFNLLDKRPIKNNLNDLNSASLFVIELSKSRDQFSQLEWTDPIYKERVQPYLNGLRSDSGLWYPLISEVPLLRESDTQYLFSPPL